MVLVDSCIWITAGSSRGDIGVKVALESLLEAGEAAFCGPVKLEVMGAARKERRPALDHYFKVIPWLSMSDKLWHEAVKLSWTFRNAAHTFPWNDILIATLAQHYGCRIYTIDQHFQSMTKVTPLSLYRPGYGGSYNHDAE